LIRIIFIILSSDRIRLFRRTAYSIRKGLATGKFREAFSRSFQEGFSRGNGESSFRDPGGETSATQRIPQHRTGKETGKA